MAPNYITYVGDREWRIGFGPLNGKDYIAMTTDVGITWREDPYPRWLTNKASCYLFPLDTNRWALLRAQIRIPYITPISFLTINTDHGATWQQPTQWWTDQPIISCLFWDSKRGIVFGTESLISITIDGGDTWRTLESVPSRGYTAAYVDDTTFYMSNSFLRFLRNYPSAGYPSNDLYHIVTSGLVFSIYSGGKNVYFLTNEGRCM